MQGGIRHMRLEFVLTFVAGIAVSAATNLLTGLNGEEPSGWRIGAVGSFLVASFLFFGGAVLEDAAPKKAQQAYPRDSRRAREEEAKYRRQLIPLHLLSTVLFLGALGLFWIGLY